MNQAKGLLPETEKAYLLAGKHSIEKFGFMNGVWIPKNAVQIV